MDQIESISSEPVEPAKLEPSPSVTPISEIFAPAIETVELVEQLMVEEPSAFESELESEIGSEPEPEPAAAVVANPGQIESSEDWIAIFAGLPLQGMLKSICGQLSFRQKDADQIVFDIDASVAGVLSDKYQSKFAEMLSGYLNQNLQVVIESQDNPNESPTARNARLQAEALEKAQADLLGSEAAQILTETFNAKLVPGSVCLK